MPFTATCTVSTGVFLIFSITIFEIEAIKASGGGFSVFWFLLE